MAITNTTLASPTYNGNGATTAFATGFQFLNNADLRVSITDADGVETVKTLTTHYTVIGAGNPSGGTVTFLVAPASGEKVNIISNVTLDQQTDYLEGGSFSAETHERALDKLTKITQQLQEQIDRSLTLPVVNQSIETTTGVVTPGYVLRVNTAGDGLEWASVTDAVLELDTTPFAQTLLDDTSAAEARTTLGLGSLATASTASLSQGGTGASLADPNADRILFWDDSAGQVTWLTPGTNLTITGTTIDAGGGGGSSDSFTTIAVSGQSNIVADSSTDTLTLVAGSGITITTDAGTDTITFAATANNAATQAEQETASSTSVYVSPGRQQFHPSAAKAWVRFNGTGTVSINASYNVGSITDHGTGDYTVNFTTAFSSGNYGVSGMTRVSGAGGTIVQPADSSAPTASSCRIWTLNTTFDYGDALFVSCSFFGDQ